LEADTKATTNVTVVVTIVTVATVTVTATIDEFQLSIGQFNFANWAHGEAAALLVAQALTILIVFPCPYDVKTHL
jgi:hypothetical protein